VGCGLKSVIRSGRLSQVRRGPALSPHSESTPANGRAANVPITALTITGSVIVYPSQDVSGVGMPAACGEYSFRRTVRPQALTVASAARFRNKKNTPMK